MLIVCDFSLNSVCKWGFLEGSAESTFLFHFFIVGNWIDLVLLICWLLIGVKRLIHGVKSIDFDCRSLNTFAVGTGLTVGYLRIVDGSASMLNGFTVKNQRCNLESAGLRCHWYRSWSSQCDDKAKDPLTRSSNEIFEGIFFGHILRDDQLCNLAALSMTPWRHSIKRNKQMRPVAYLCGGITNFKFSFVGVCKSVSTLIEMETVAGDLFHLALNWFEWINLKWRQWIFPGRLHLSTKVYRSIQLIYCESGPSGADRANKRRSKRTIWNLFQTKLWRSRRRWSRSATLVRIVIGKDQVSIEIRFKRWKPTLQKWWLF